MMQRKFFLSGALALAVSACTPSLASFNRRVPHDGETRRVVRDAAFGNGPRQKLDVYAPLRIDSAAPVIVFFYGGSWQSGERADYGFVGDAFASRGFITVIPDYRVAPDVFPSFIEDGALALKWVQANIASYGGDARRVVLVGHSSGAYIAMMLALDQSYLWRAGVDARTIRGAVGMAGPYDFYPYDVPSTIAAFGHAGDPHTTQPIHFARGDAPPLLLLWGERDDLVGRRNIASLEAAVRGRGGAVETRTYPRVGHIGLMLALSAPLRGTAPALADITSFARRVAEP